MAELPPRRKVRDVELLSALAHPLRAAILRYVMSVGPRTASECADAVGSSASNCSWHLRQLARFGLVESTDGGDGRQRPWRATVVGLDLGELADDPTTRAAQLAVFGTALVEEQKLTQRFLERSDDLEPEWRTTGTVNTYSLTVNAAELAELAQRVDDLIRPYVSTIRKDAPDDARPVHAGFRGFLRLER
ncbi:MAG TPA: helix-turn-helix domain-containing protein [Actinophytocola sp.]|uniref:helix-turn-helix domain-containing protein n=1 Tax=Actinophytocola sp. TaxID=1872138 RepID=UPI002F91E479